jgi:hypothetical protein
MRVDHHGRRAAAGDAIEQGEGLEATVPGLLLLVVVVLVPAAVVVLRPDYLPPLR